MSVIFMLINSLIIHYMVAVHLNAMLHIERAFRIIGKYFFD